MTGLGTGSRSWRTASTGLLRLLCWWVSGQSGRATRYFASRVVTTETLLRQDLLPRSNLLGNWLPRFACHGSTPAARRAHLQDRANRAPALRGPAPCES